MKRSHPNFRERVETLLGKHGTATRLADALGYKRPHVSLILNGHKPIPEPFVAVVEFLERTPPKDWPERWK